MSKLDDLLTQMEDAIEDEVNRRFIEAFNDLSIYISPGNDGRLTVTVASNAIDGLTDDEGRDDILSKEEDLAELIALVKRVLGNEKELVNQQLIEMVKL
jgi:hypothetical protein